MKYCITASAESINIYNLFNDELMYSYNKGISIDTINIPRKDGFYNFFIKSDLFEEDFENKMIILDGTVR
jgi:hypothetical protein